jgi:hypothetical protein
MEFEPSMALWLDWAREPDESGRSSLPLDHIWNSEFGPEVVHRTSGEYKVPLTALQGRVVVQVS